MPTKPNVISSCPCCQSTQRNLWHTEGGHSIVKCGNCGFLFLNPRPDDDERAAATVDGAFGGDNSTDISERYSPSKVRHYQALYKTLIADAAIPVRGKRWLDVGCGYGEVMQAISKVAGADCIVKGVEPMKIKAAYAKNHGLEVINDFYSPQLGNFDVISIHDVFSHIPEPRLFLRDIRSGTSSGGHLIIETGNLADLANRAEFSGELGLPDHMIFAGANSLRLLLEGAGFRVKREFAFPIDGPLYALKTLVKFVLGRRVTPKLPYTSPYRTLVFVAEAD